MNDPEFEDFPISYRLSQRSMLAAIVTLLFSRRLFAPQWPDAMKWVLAGVIASIVVFALVASCYVVVRYPYLSLVQPSDGDMLSKQFTSKLLTRVTKAVGLATLSVLLFVLVLASWNNGIASVSEALLLAYVAILFCFLVYLCFFYDAELHPTIATFIRSTLGLGIPLFPFFIPVLIVGSIRCRRLLEDEIHRQQFDN